MTNPATATIPVPPPCVTCDHAKADHGHEGCDITIATQTIKFGPEVTSAPVFCPCEAYLDPEDVCRWCEGAGTIPHANPWYDGRECQTCGGTGVNA